MTEATYSGVHHVQLAIPAGSEQQARTFYGAVLGMEELAKPPVLAARGGCWFKAGGWEIHLGVETPFTAARKAHPGVLVPPPRVQQRSTTPIAASAHRLLVRWCALHR